MSTEPAEPTEGTEPTDSRDGIVVRTAGGDDLGGVISVGHRTWLATYEPIAGPEYVAMGLAKWWTPDVISATIRTGRTIVADKRGTVIGVATWGAQQGDAVLWKLYVLPGHHGKGVGSRLLAEVERRAVEQGHERLVLSHISGNAQAAAFYRARGFCQTHTEEGGSGMPDSVWVAKSLDGVASEASPTEASPTGASPAEASPTEVSPAEPEPTSARPGPDEEDRP